MTSVVCADLTAFAESILTTSLKILPYRPPARLIRAKYRGRVEPKSCFTETKGIVNKLYLVMSKYGSKQTQTLFNLIY